MKATGRSSYNITCITEQQPYYENIHFIAFVALLVRLAVVLAFDFIHHPDEIFQYLEPAHRLAYGYGMITWEYRLGVRSWVLPSLISSILQFFHALGLDRPAMYVPAIKVLFSTLSVSLVYASGIIVKKFGSERAALVAAWFTCFWYELIYFSGRATPEVLAAYCVVSALALAVLQRSRIHAAAIGFLCAFSLILRMQYLPVSFVVLAYALFTADNPKRLIMIAAFVMIIALAGWLDYLTWGAFFASYYYNYLYNVRYRFSWYFGMNPRLFFVTALRMTSGGLFWMVLPPSLLPSLIKKTGMLLLCALAVIIPHSLTMHKEYRFIFAAIPFLCMVTAIVLTDGLSGLGNRSHLGRNLPAYALAALLVISLNGALGKIPDEDKIYLPLMTKDQVLSAYLFLHDEPGLTAVYTTYWPWYRTGGYYYLHKNVPIYCDSHLAAIDLRNYRKIISHIVCRYDFPSIPGFAPVFRSGDVEVRRVVTPPRRYQTLNIDTFNVPQPGVDGHFKPLVRRLL